MSKTLFKNNDGWAVSRISSLSKEGCELPGDGNFPIYNIYKKSSTELQKTCKLPSTKKIPQLREKVLYFYIIQKYPANKVFNNEHIMKIYYSESISFHKYYPLEPETQVLMLKY